MDFNEFISQARENCVSEIKITLSKTKVEEVEYVYEDGPMRPIPPLKKDEDDEEDEFGDE